jgi:hypothetical protein
MRALERRQPLLEDADAQPLVERRDLDDETPGQAGPDSLVQVLEFGRRAIGRDHDLPARIDQRIQRVTEFLLDGPALDELHIVDHEQVDAAQALLERVRGLRLQRRHEPVHEAVCGKVDHPPSALLSRLSDRMHQVGLAQPTPA